HDVAIPRQTLCRWLTLAAFWLRPLYELIKTTVLDGHYVQVDEPSGARQPAWLTLILPANADRISESRQWIHKVRLSVDRPPAGRRYLLYMASGSRGAVPGKHHSRRLVGHYANRRVSRLFRFCAAARRAHGWRRPA